MQKLISKLTLPLLSLALVVPGVSEASSSAGAKARAFTRPAGVPADYVPTPFGLYVSSKCVIVLGPADYNANGVLISDEEGIQQPDGSYRPIPACTLPRYNRDGSPYQPGADLRDMSSKNHDLTISYETSTPLLLRTNVTFPAPGASNHPFPVPKNVSGQTIFLTGGITGGDKGWLQFWGFNMSGYEGSWRAGAALADVNGNVIIVTASDPALGSPAFDFFISNDSAGKMKWVYRGQLHFDYQRTPWTQYLSNSFLSTYTLFTIQTFNVTSCDMLPDTTKIQGFTLFSTTDRGTSYSVAPTVRSSGLCNLAAIASQNTSRPEFTITYDTSSTSKGRPAKITFRSE